MRNKLVWLVSCLLLNPLVMQYRSAVPGYHYEFPRDNFNHPDFQTEWWYYTGNLRTADGHEFGFELTFFREALTREAQKASDWSAPDAFVAHLALSDISGGKFYHRERLNRAGPGIAAQHRIERHGGAQHRRGKMLFGQIINVHTDDAQ